MTIHLILGRQGSGKTLLMVKLAWDYYHRAKNAKIYTNFHLKFPYRHLHFKEIINCQLTDCKTFLDEVHLLLPARRSMKSTSVKICDRFLSMARKQNNEIYGSTQIARKVDVRFREEADYLYFCSKWAYINERWVEILHESMLRDDDLVMIKVEVEDTITGNMVRFAFNGNKYYDLYDTREIVDIEGMPD